jgi:metacaspase-1
MARGISLHVGVDRPDPRRYEVIRPLRACANDARAMQRLAAAEGFATELVLDGEASAGAVTGKIAAAAETVGSDGIFLLTYSGHGSRVRDVDGDEGDGYDESWCLYDGELVDDELYRLWGRFPRGARIVVVSDSCHSGTVIRIGDKGAAVVRRPREPVLRGGQRRRPRVVRVRPPGSGPRRFADGTEVVVGASVVLLAAALDHQTAAEGPRHGAFTEALLAVWDGGRFQGSYRDLQGAIFERLRGRQDPCLERTGVRNPAFEAQRPFTIEPPQPDSAARD